MRKSIIETRMRCCSVGQEGSEFAWAFMSVCREDSYDTARMLSLVWALSARLCNKCKKLCFFLMFR